MQRTARAPKRTSSGLAGVKIVAVLAITMVMLAGSALSAYGSESTAPGPDITGLNLDQYGADVAVEPQTETGAIPDATGLNLDQYGADTSEEPPPAVFFIYGDPFVLSDAGHWVAGPHHVAGGDEGPIGGVIPFGH